MAGELSFLFSSFAMKVEVITNTSAKLTAWVNHKLNLVALRLQKIIWWPMKQEVLASKRSLLYGVGLFVFSIACSKLVIGEALMLGKYAPAVLQVWGFPALLTGLLIISGCLHEIGQLNWEKKHHRAYFNLFSIFGAVISSVALSGEFLLEENIFYALMISGAGLGVLFSSLLYTIFSFFPKYPVSDICWSDE